MAKVAMTGRQVFEMLRKRGLTQAEAVAALRKEMERQHPHLSAHDRNILDAAAALAV